MLHSRSRDHAAPAAAGASARSADRGEILTSVMLAVGTVAIASFVDIFGWLASWSAAPWGWLLNQLWALLVVMAIGFGVIAARRRNQLELAVQGRLEAERRLAGFVAASSEWCWEIDAEQRLVSVSERAPAALVELARAQAPWRPGGALVDDEGWVRHRADLVRGRPVREFRFRLLDADGGERHLQISGNPVHGADGQLLGFEGTGTDVTSAAVAQAEAQRLAAFDVLTGLTNRAGLIDRCEHALAWARHRRARGALLCLNLDRFSELNDTLGHALGDRALKACAERLQGCLEPGDTLARIGGDEFAIVQLQSDQPGAAERLCQRLADTLATPLAVDGESLVLTASIGVALIPDDGANADDLLKHADLALHRAQSEGRGGASFFAPEMNAELWRRKTVEADLWQALAAGEFSLQYQPQIDAASRAVIGLEALLRWHHPDHGLVPPADFLPIAEQSDLIMPLCGFVMREACAQAAAWPTIAMSVNLSPAQFLHRELPSQVHQALEETGLAPERLVLEINESALLQDTRLACELLDRLKQLGVRIAIDDFGSGYSSLSYLQKFDKIKIARTFTGALGRDEGTDALILAVMGLGRMLGIAVSAEGVETAEQSGWLRESGCDELQGFHFSRPLDAAEIDALLRAAERAPAVADLAAAISPAA